jgi:hypothetical protein
VDEKDWPSELDELIDGVERADDPYEAALSVLGCAVNYMTESVVASRLYQIWAELTDAFELQQDRARALTEMRRASSEWPPIRDDSLSRQTYLNHWQYDVCGYQRPIGS